MYVFAPGTKEKVYHSDGVVEIRAGWASFSGRHYKLVDITQAEVVAVRTDTLPLWALGFAGMLVWMVVVLLVLVVVAGNLGTDATRLAGLPFREQACFIYLVMGGVWLLFAIAAWRGRTSAPLYVLRLTGEFGTANALVCLDKGYVKEVERALREALASEPLEQIC